jgi:hypothetical protein
MESPESPLSNKPYIVCFGVVLGLQWLNLSYGPVSHLSSHISMSSSPIAFIIGMEWRCKPHISIHAIWETIEGELHVQE